MASPRGTAFNLQPTSRNFHDIDSAPFDFRVGIILGSQIAKKLESIIKRCILKFHARNLYGSQFQNQIRSEFRVAGPGLPGSFDKDHIYSETTAIEF
jgi:hypothetical protein